MSGKRAKNLRGHGGGIWSNGFRKIDTSPARLELLREGARWAAFAQRVLKLANKNGRGVQNHQYISTFRCAYRNVKRLYMRHRARTGVSL